MNKILACPYCGPKPNQARLKCERCGRELTLVDHHRLAGERPLRAWGAVVDRETDNDGARPARSVSGRLGFRLGIAASVFALVAVAALLGLRRGPAGVGPAGVARAAATIAAQPESPPSIPDPGSETAAEPAPPTGGAGADQRGNLARVLDRFRAALAERPADAQLLDNVGQILVAMNRPAEAVPYLKQAVEAEPFSLTARFDLAVAYARCGQLQEAVGQYGELVQAGTADPRVYHNLGLTLRQLGRNAEATAAFERATTLAPDQSASWLGLALSLETDARGSEAAAALERVLTLEPDRADASSIRARIARLRAATGLSSPLPPDGGNLASRRGQ